jgi:hypothetical protein
MSARKGKVTSNPHPNEGNSQSTKSKARGKTELKEELPRTSPLRRSLRGNPESKEQMSSDKK